MTAAEMDAYCVCACCCDFPERTLAGRRDCSCKQRLSYLVEQAEEINGRVSRARAAISEAAEGAAREYWLGQLALVGVC